jgi:RNA-binding motif X-linked protein 2
MNAIRQTQKLNEQELEQVTKPEASWHRDYSDTAFIFIGGLDTRLSEGDVITIFSQYGEPVFINMVRDKETGKSKGFCFLKYEDQRSCDLAVDNLGGASVLGRLLNVDHTRYKKRDDEEIVDNTMGPQETVAVGNGATDVTNAESEEDTRPLLKEEIELAELMRNEDDDDPMKAYMIKQKREDVEVARMALAKREQKSKDGKHKRDKNRRSRKQDDSDSQRKERRRHRHRSRSPDREGPSKPSQRELSTTPVFDRGPEKPRSKRENRSRSPYRDGSRTAKESRSGRREKSRTRSRTPIYHSEDSSTARRRKRERSLSRDRRR